MYATLDNDVALGPKVKLPKTWADKHELQGWVGDRVKEVLGKHISPNADFFQQGIDRLVIYLDDNCTQMLTE